MRTHRSLGSLAALALGIAFSVQTIGFGQQQGGGQAPQQPPSAPPGGSPGSVPSPSAPPSRTPTQPPMPGERTREPDFGRETRMPEMERPIFLSGKVVLEDGTTPPETVLIERVCNGIARPEGYSDSRGRFSFQLGQNTGIIPDASVSSGPDEFGGFGGTRGGLSSTGRSSGGSRIGLEQRLSGCELRASLPGFRSEAVSLAGRRVMDNPDVGTIILRRLGHVEGTTISITSLQAPRDAKKAYERGLAANKKQKWDDARKHLEKAVAAYPQYAAAWFELGFAHEQQDKPDEARKAYEQALAADSKYLKPYMQLAGMSFREKNWQEVADTTERLLRLNPLDFPAAYLYNSIANFSMQRLDVAEKSAREALKLENAHRVPKLQHVLGIILANKHEYAGAAQHLSKYLEQAPDAQDAETVRKQLVELQRLAAGSANVQPAP